MAEVKSTRLRSIQTKTIDTLEMAVESLPFKIEIKGSPYLAGNGYWCVHFVIPDNAEFESVVLGD